MDKKICMILKVVRRNDEYEIIFLNKLLLSLEQKTDEQNIFTKH